MTVRKILLILWKVKKKIVSFSSYRLLISTTNVAYSRIIPKTTLQEESVKAPFALLIRASLPGIPHPHGIMFWLRTGYGKRGRMSR